MLSQPAKVKSSPFHKSVDFIIATSGSRPDPSRNFETAIPHLFGRHETYWLPHCRSLLAPPKECISSAPGAAVFGFGSGLERFLVKWKLRYPLAVCFAGSDTVDMSAAATTRFRPPSLAS